tara:strand:- start:2559 stop:2759 length:201 start_codon:yes stop_codon:yes gene_type:complete
LVKAANAEKIDRFRHNYSMETIISAVTIAGIASVALLWGFCVLGAAMVLKEAFGEQLAAIVERLRR